MDRDLAKKKIHHVATGMPPVNAPTPSELDRVGPAGPDKELSSRPAVAPPTLEQRRVRAVAPYLSGSPKPTYGGTSAAKEHSRAEYAQPTSDAQKAEPQRPSLQEEGVRGPFARPEGPSEPIVGAPPPTREQAPVGRNHGNLSSSAGKARDHKRSLSAAPARTRESTDLQGLIPVQVEVLDQHDMPVRWLAYRPDPDLTLKYYFVEPAKGSSDHAGEKVEAPGAPVQPVRPTKEHAPVHRIVVRVIPAGDFVNLEARLINAPSGIEKRVLTQSRVPPERAAETVRQLVRSLLDKT